MLVRQATLIVDRELFRLGVLKAVVLASGYQHDLSLFDEMTIQRIVESDDEVSYIIDLVHSDYKQPELTVCEFMFPILEPQEANAS